MDTVDEDPEGNDNGCYYITHKSCVAFWFVYFGYIENFEKFVFLLVKKGLQVIFLFLFSFTGFFKLKIRQIINLQELRRR